MFDSFTDEEKNLWKDASNTLTQDRNVAVKVFYEEKLFLLILRTKFQCL